MRKNQQQPRRPDYNVAAMLKGNDMKARVGAAWDRPDGSIRVKLNNFVVLTGSDDLVITLFPADDRNNTPPSATHAEEFDDYDGPAHSVPDDDVPF